MVRTKTQSAQTFSFEQDTYPSLILREDLLETWNDIDIDSLPAKEQDGLIRLLEASGIISQDAYDPEKVLLVKANQGIVKAIYGPGIFRDGDSIILKVNANTVKINQTGDRLIVGQLKGKLNVQTQQDVTGKEYPVAYCSFVDKEKSVFKVRVALDLQDNSLTAEDIEATIINEEPIINFLAQAPTPALPMQELGIGEWQVKAISQMEGEFGTNYKLHLSNGLAVWAKGNSKTLIASGFQIPSDSPVTLVITNIEDLGDNKYRVDNALRLRLPHQIGNESSFLNCNSETVTQDSIEANDTNPSQDLDHIPF